MIVDPISNVLNQIKLASRTKKKSVTFFSSKTIIEILKVIKEEGYIIDFITKTSDKNISTTTVYFKYKKGVSAIFGIKRVSKPSQKVIAKANKLPIVMNGMGTAIMTTNRGIMCEKTARKLNVGGEVFAYIW